MGINNLGVLNISEAGARTQAESKGDNLGLIHGSVSLLSRSQTTSRKSRQMPGPDILCVYKGGTRTHTHTHPGRERDKR
jgi:hypothetical protein